jgi:menaquinone-dependent protoporphyrinogen oxidase
MQTYVLVAYASKYGATREIAERICQVLNASGLVADAEPIHEIRDLTPYTAVVLGSAIYAGQWMGEAIAFLKEHELLLARRPVWFFSSGPTGEGDPVELLKGWRFPEAHKALSERIQPRDTTVFHGALQMNRLNFAEKLIVKGVKAPVGDFRDWQAVTTWAERIAEALTQVAQPSHNNTPSQA